MRKISVWAARHKWPARILLISSLLLLNVSGIITGLLLKQLGMILPGITFLFSVLIYFSGVLFYPLRSQKKQFRHGTFYTRQKTCDGLLAAAAFLMFVCISNDKTPFKTYFSNYKAAASASIPASVKDSSVKGLKLVVAFAKSMKDENGNLLKWKERKKLLYEQIKVIKKSNEMSKGGKTALLILCVLVAIGLITLALSLACNLSCNGQDGAAVLVGIGGPALIIFLLVLAIRGIYPGKRKKRKKIE